MNQKTHLRCIFPPIFKDQVFNFQYSQLIPGELSQSFETGPEHGRCPESHGGTLGLQNEAEVGLDKGDHPEEGADVNWEDHPRGRGVLVVGHVDRETLLDGDLKQKQSQAPLQSLDVKGQSMEFQLNAYSYSVLYHINYYSCHKINFHSSSSWNKISNMNV